MYSWRGALWKRNFPFNYNVLFEYFCFTDNGLLYGKRTWGKTPEHFYPLFSILPCFFCLLMLWCNIYVYLSTFLCRQYGRNVPWKVVVEKRVFGMCVEMVFLNRKDGKELWFHFAQMSSFQEAHHVPYFCFAIVCWILILNYVINNHKIGKQALKKACLFPCLIWREP